MTSVAAKAQHDPEWEENGRTSSGNEGSMHSINNLLQGQLTASTLVLDCSRVAG